MRTPIALLLLLLCACWSCAERLEAGRAERDRAWREERCERVCGSAFHECTLHEYHTKMACSEAYNDCVRECR